MTDVTAKISVKDCASELKNKNLSILKKKKIKHQKEKNLDKILNMEEHEPRTQRN